MCIYIYIYIHKGDFLPYEMHYPELGKGTNGVSTNGVTADSMISFDRGTFGVLPLTYFYLPKSGRAYLFSQSVKNIYLCSGPISVDPICLQPTNISLQYFPAASCPSPI